VIENSQRDLNIAFVNELAKIFNRLNIDTLEVLEAAGTKWNFLPFRPGLVGGHCIGVDPYYLTYKAQELGYRPEVILAGRCVNDGMGQYVATEVVKLMIKKNHVINSSRVLVLGITFKENCPDIRNSRAIDLIRGLEEFGCSVDVYDPWADAGEAKAEYGIDLLSGPDVLRKLKSNYDAVVLAVAHDRFDELDFNKFSKDGLVIYDIKNYLPRNIIDARL
ncbi:MAG: Vi polysaccharide biosynthesis UDP-N-acetylglucosamine C-6 dehydrogenase TviB, partial [Victivallaceae bacterium]|nr:Vi polysaccharide biosynthesis UDP-N-acetylglucosamine C-6 dehydrogenase TviB [Victivallaceae bacterium]